MVMLIQIRRYRRWNWMEGRCTDGKFFEDVCHSILEAHHLVYIVGWWICRKADEDKMSEFEVWHGLANLYSTLSHWKDVEVCLEKAGALKQYSPEKLHAEGMMYEGKGQIRDAMTSYYNALLQNPMYVPCKIRLGALLPKISSRALPAARSLLSDALRVEPTNRKAWYYLGMVHKEDGRMADAIECFQAASILEESDPLESFS